MLVMPYLIASNDVVIDLIELRQTLFLRLLEFAVRDLAPSNFFLGQNVHQRLIPPILLSKLQ
jgi:hypothetical protein